MSLHKSLKQKNALQRRRNVLTRAERIEILEDRGKWDPEEDSIFGLPKTKVITLAGRPKKREEDEEEEGEEGLLEGAEAAEAPEE
jgi:small basic protein (TIGR04137 family)